MSAPLTFTEAELIEIAEGLESRANYARGRYEKARAASVRDYQAGVAQTSSDAAKRIRDLIESKRPVPALRVVGGRDAQAHV